MRFIKYINEGYKEIYHLEEANEIISGRCKEYLKLIKGKLPLYRGMNAKGLMGIKDIRKDRRSKGHSFDIDKRLNIWLKENGHAERSKSVITTSHKDDTGLFHMQYYVFILDKFKYTWIDAKDLNGIDMTTGWSPMVLNFFPYDLDSIVLNKDVKDYFHTNKGFDKAYNKGYEMWFEGKEYLYVNTFFKWDRKKQRLYKK